MLASVRFPILFAVLFFLFTTFLGDIWDRESTSSIRFTILGVFDTALISLDVGLGHCLDFTQCLVFCLFSIVEFPVAVHYLDWTVFQVLTGLGGRNQCSIEFFSNVSTNCGGSFMFAYLTIACEIKVSILKLADFQNMQHAYTKGFD